MPHLLPDALPLGALPVGFFPDKAFGCYMLSISGLLCYTQEKGHSKPSTCTSGW